MSKQKRYHLLQCDELIASFDTIQEVISYLTESFSPDEDDMDDDGQYGLWIAETVKLVELKTSVKVEFKENSD